MTLLYDGPGLAGRGRTQLAIVDDPAGSWLLLRVRWPEPAQRVERLRLEPTPHGVIVRVA